MTVSKYGVPVEGPGEGDLAARVDGEEEEFAPPRVAAAEGAEHLLAGVRLPRRLPGGAEGLEGGDEERAGGGHRREDTAPTGGA